MNSIKEPISVGESGLPNTSQPQQQQPAMPALKPWEIAELPLFHSPDRPPVDVEHATDAEFESWRRSNGIPAKAGKWSFERRCKAINMCRFYGTWNALRFPLEFCAEQANDAQKCADDAQNSSQTVLNNAVNEKTMQKGETHLLHDVE